MDLKKIVDLSGKTAIITGGAGLLGRVYASTLLENGAKVIALDKKINQSFVINQIKNEFKLDQKKIKNLKLIQCDITDSKQINNTFQELSEIKDLKILVNNASLVKQVGKDNLVDSYKTFLEMKPNDWEEFFSVDLTGTLLMSQKVIPHMQKNGGGSIINISSTYGILSPDQRLQINYYC